MYKISELNIIDTEAKASYRGHFDAFFKDYDYSKISGVIKLVPIKTHHDLSKVRAGSGLYFILSNYQHEDNKCKLAINEMKVIYRGHGIKIRKRVESHIFNSQYRDNRENTHYGVCMKLDNNNSINIDNAPYSSSKWAVVYHPMTDSTKTMREQAELAFDERYFMPLGSRAYNCMQSKVHCESTNQH